jgi:hypothetical protein
MFNDTENIKDEKIGFRWMNNIYFLQVRLILIF